MLEEKKYDVVLIGSNRRNDYLGARTFYLKEVLAKHKPDLSVAVYDCHDDDDDKRVNIDSARNCIFLPWVETIDMGWIDFLTHAKCGNKILYTENYWWYEEQKARLLRLGFNLENLFETIAFSTHEQSTWWNDMQYTFWGVVLHDEFFSGIDDDRQNDVKTVFVDQLWPLDDCDERYNALPILNRRMPEFKAKFPDIKVVSPGCDESWVDESVEKDMDLRRFVKTLAAADLFVVSHVETCGLPQMEAMLCGTKVVTTKRFSCNTALLPGALAYELWESEDDFVDALARGVSGYDRRVVRRAAMEAFDSSVAADRIFSDLRGVG